MMKAAYRFNRKGQLVLTTGEGSCHVFACVSAAVRWCERNGVTAEEQKSEL